MKYKLEARGDRISHFGITVIMSPYLPPVSDLAVILDVVKTVLIKDGGQIIDDPFFLNVGGVDFFIDLGAEKLLVAEREGKKIAVEIKSFISTSSAADFHLAIGQFINYRVA